MAKTRFTQAQTVASAGFRGLVKASVMVTAYMVLQDTGDPDYDQRAGLSRLMFGVGNDDAKASVIEQFCWWAVNDPTVIAEYVDAAGDVSQINDATIDAATLAFWNMAASVQVEG